MVTRQTFSSSTEAFDKVVLCRGFFCTSNWGACPGDQRKWKYPRFKNQWHWIKTKYVCRWSYSVYKRWAFGQSLLQPFKCFWFLLRSENKNRRNVAWKPKMPLGQTRSVAWPEQYVFALGVAFAYDSTTSYKINVVEKLVMLKNVLNQWTTRNLTLLGRIFVLLKHSQFLS